MSNEIRVYYHPRSPYSRLGVHLLADRAIPCRAIPFTGPPEGVAFADPSQNPAKLAYFRQDIARMTARLGLPLQSPATMDPDFDLAIRAGIAAELAGNGLAFAHLISEARWGRGADVSDPSVVESCLEQAGGGESDGRAVKRAYVEHRRLIEADQVFGVPFLVWVDQKYWGHDRFELFLDVYREAGG